jgi:hypothetical protein
MPDRPDQPDPELLAAIRTALADPDPGRGSVVLHDILGAVDGALILGWLRADEQPALPQLLLAIQAAVEALEGIGLALAEGEGQTNAEGRGVGRE